MGLIDFEVSKLLLPKQRGCTNALQEYGFSDPLGPSRTFWFNRFGSTAVEPINIVDQHRSSTSFINIVHRFDGSTPG